MDLVADRDDAVRAGKILYVGASNIEAWWIAVARGVSELRGLVRFEWVQSSYSLLDRIAEHEMLPFCADQRVGFTAFSPLAGGWLTGKYPAKVYPEGSRMTLWPEPYLHLGSGRVFRGLEGYPTRRGRGGRDGRARPPVGAAPAVGRRGDPRPAHAGALGERAVGAGHRAVGRRAAALAALFES